MSYILYKYNKDFIYTSQEESEIYLPIENIPQVGSNETLVAIPSIIPEDQFVRFNIINETWEFVYIGDYYDILNGNLSTIIPVLDSDNYTLIAPPILELGDEVYFNGASWIYKKTSKLTLDTAIANLKTKYEVDYQNSKSKFILTIGGKSVDSRITGLDEYINILNQICSFEVPSLTINGNILTLQEAVLIGRYLFEQRFIVTSNLDNVIKPKISSLTTMEEVDLFIGTPPLVFPSSISVESILGL